MKEMKNIKTPAYAQNLGTGAFMAAQPTYQCEYCGKTAYTPNPPRPMDMWPCAQGKPNHRWVKC
jgi:hypothetical protein